jgi:hypothetical protein
MGFVLSLVVVVFLVMTAVAFVSSPPGCSAETDLQGRRDSSFGNPNQPANTDISRIVARPLIE